jgi:hypothetical protein
MFNAVVFSFPGVVRIRLHNLNPGKTYQHSRRWHLGSMWVINHWGHWEQILSLVYQVLFVQRWNIRVCCISNQVSASSVPNLPAANLLYVAEDPSIDSDIILEQTVWIVQMYLMWLCAGGWLVPSYQFSRSITFTSVSQSWFKLAEAHGIFHAVGHQFPKFYDDSSGPSSQNWPTRHAWGSFPAHYSSVLSSQFCLR